MTIKELFDTGHDRVRKPFWNDQSFLQLDRVTLPDGRICMGPWCNIVDPCSMAAFEYEGEPEEYPSRKLLVMDYECNDDGSADNEWEAFTGEAPEDLTPYGVGWHLKPPRTIVR